MNFRGNVITIRPKETVCVVASSGRIAIGFVCVVLKASGQSDVFFVCLTRSDFCRDGSWYSKNPILLARRAL